MFSSVYLSEVARIASQVDHLKIEAIVDKLVRVRNNGGTVFVIGLGGSAANASHMVNDLRKLCGINAYTPTDNVSELTARTNDSVAGWNEVFSEWLRTSGFNDNDVLFVLSVGGGHQEPQVSMPIVNAIGLAKVQDAWVCGIVGRDDGYITTLRDQSTILVVPNVQAKRVTPHTEEFQMVVIHCIVSHPDLQLVPTKW